MHRVLIVAIPLAATGIGAAAPEGRVVRVERSRAPARAPVVCDFDANLEARCHGRPAIGDVVVVADATSVLAEVELTAVTAVASKCDTLWTVRGALRSGRLAGPRPSRRLGVFDPASKDRRLRTVDAEPPTGNPEESVVAAYDRDGDGTPDVLLTRYSCDEHGAIAANGVDTCRDVYARIGDALRRTSQTRQMGCT
ncbi:MAG: hypothetical protein KIT31_05035 [Deltaproteobacteria bacterium]|nr:hypothetical protein [Deltaproteobacteria bacterium]